jgi:small subunit ribosomal protein S15
MALTSEAKAQLVGEYQRFGGDTGSCEVQIALLSADIDLLTQHIKQHRKDNHSERGLLLKVSQRNRLLRYFKRTASSRYQTLIKRLGLRDKA